MKLFNNEDKCLDLRNQIIFIWKSVLNNIENMNNMDELFITNAKEYVVNPDSMEKLNSMINRLPAIQDKFFNLLDLGNANNIEEHYEFMSKYSSSILQQIDKTIEWIQNRNTTQRIEITRNSLIILLRLKTVIEEFMNEFELR